MNDNKKILYELQIVQDETGAVLTYSAFHNDTDMLTKIGVVHLASDVLERSLTNILSHKEVKDDNIVDVTKK
jgi:hypothetical protein